MVGLRSGGPNQVLPNNVRFNVEQLGFLSVTISLPLELLTDS